MLQSQKQNLLGENDMQNMMGRIRRCAEDYNMITEGDKIAVGVSGGKDSLTLLYLLAALRRYYPAHYELQAVTIDMGLPGMDFSPVAALCEKLEVPYQIKKTEIGPIIFDYRHEKNPCSMCAKMRRGALNDVLLTLGCNKIALGHHFSDVIETTVMGMFYGSQLQAMPPKLRSRNFPGMELIRPMYCIHEDDIIAWQRYNSLEFIQCACRFTERAATHGNDGSSSKRQEVKLLLRELRRKNPDIEKSIFHSIHSVCLDTMVGYKSGGVEHTFADCYRERGEMEKEETE